MIEDKKYKQPSNTSNVLQDRSIIALFEKLGLSRNAAKCYLACLTLGSAKISEVAKAARVNRVNAYDAVEGLLKRILLEQEVIHGGRRIRPAPLENLVEYARDYQKKATKLRWKVEDLVPALMALSIKQTGQTLSGFEGITIFRGDEGMERIAERSLAVARGSVNYYMEVEDFFILASNPKYDEDYYIPTRIKRGIVAHVLARDNQYGKRLAKYDASEMRKTRFLNPEVKFPCAIFTYGNEVAFIWKKEDIIGITIKGSPIVAVIKMLFELAWEKARKTRIKNV